MLMRNVRAAYDTPINLFSNQWDITKTINSNF